jgi:thiol-activated cytolysin
MKITMITKNHVSRTTLFGLLLMMSFSCTKEDIEKQLLAAEEVEEINAALAQLDDFVQDAEIGQPELVEETVMRNDEDARQECVVEMYKAAPGYDEMLTLDPTTDVIYPGAMLKGESIPTGEYIGINGGRAPITLSVSLENLNGSPSVRIDDPRLSTVRAGVKDLLQQGVTGATAAELVYETRQVYSEQHLNLALGANYRGATKSVSSSFNFSSSSYQYKYVIKYLQVYYTIDLDLPDNNNPSALFSAVPVLNSTSPVIVSSVKYGRMVLYTVESNYSQSEIQAAFNASFASADGSVDASYQKVLSESSIKGIVIGGSGADAAQIVDGPQGVYNYIAEGGNFSAESPAAPLAYTLRYIRQDFPVARVVLATEYPVRTCYEAYQKFRVEIYGFNCKENDNEVSPYEIYGSMSAKVYQNGKEAGGTSWRLSRDNDQKVDEDKFYEIDKWKEVELYKPDLGRDFVELVADMYEKDLTSDDHFGKKTRKILLRDIPDTNGQRPAEKDYIRLDLQDDNGSLMSTYFYVWRVY